MTTSSLSRVSVTVRVDADVVELVGLLAAAHGVTFSDEVRKALRRHLDAAAVEPEAGR